jgi:inner membrane protein
MDTITHMLLGATTAQLAFRQRLGRGATWAAVVAAVAPDLDILAGPVLRALGFDTGGGNHLVVHRGLSHSLLMAPVIALPIAAAWWKLRRRRAQREAADAISDVPGNGVPQPGQGKPCPQNPAPGREHGLPATRGARRSGTQSRHAPSPASFRLLYACVLVAGLTHPLLDWGTAYGTELLAPITDTRYALSCVPIIDIFYTPMLALTLLACWLVRKAQRIRAKQRVARPRASAWPCISVVQETRPRNGAWPCHPAIECRAEHPSRRATLVIGWAGFLLGLGYLVTGAVLRDRAIDMARALAGGAPILRADAYPALGSIFVWRTVVETDGRWITARIRPLARGAPPRQESAPRQTSVWIERAREMPDVRGYAWFAMGVVRATEAGRDGQHVVEFHDMRYGPRPESIDSMWPLQVTFGKQGRPLSAERRPPSTASNRWRILKETWSDLWEP